MEGNSGSSLSTFNENNLNAGGLSQPVFADEFLLRTTTNSVFAYSSPKGMLRVTSSPALATQVLVDGQIADSWGLNWLKETPGTHTVCFAHVEGGTDPQC